MTNLSVSDRFPATDNERVLRAAVAAYLGRYRGESRVHTGSDLKVFLVWCSREDLGPLALGRAEIERYVRWLQEVRCYQPSTVSRRLSVVVGFYRVCVIDEILAHSPADYVRRPPVPTESPTLGLGHLQFEALLTAARLSGNCNDFALIAMLGLLGLRIFEACDRGPILRNTAGRRMDRRAATRRLVHLSETSGIRMPRMHPQMLRHTFVTTMLDAGVSLRDVQIAVRHADPKTTMRYDRARKNLDRHPNYILAAYMASGT